MTGPTQPPDFGPDSNPLEQQREMMELLSQSTRHQVIQTILSHPDHLVSFSELDYYIQTSSQPIHDAVTKLCEADILAKYSIEDPDNPNERDYPTEFIGPTERGIRILHEFNYLGAVPVLRAVFDSTRKTDQMERHLAADRPELPSIVDEALAFETDEPTASRKDDSANSSGQQAESSPSRELDSQDDTTNDINRGEHSSDPLAELFDN